MAADRTYWFPSSTGSYSTRGGDIRIKIFYEDTAIGTAVSVDTNATISKLGKLKMPMELTPERWRLESFDFTLFGAYDLFDTYPILNDDYKNDTWVVFYINGLEYWRGLLDYDQINMKKTRLISGTYKWTEIVLPVIGAFSYIFAHEKKLDDYYMEGDYLADIITRVANDIGLPLSTNYIYNSLEDMNNNYYTWSSLSVILQDTTTPMIEWLQKLFLEMGVQATILNGRINISARNKTGSGTTISENDIKEIEIVKDNNWQHIKFQEGSDGDIIFENIINTSANKTWIINTEIVNTIISFHSSLDTITGTVENLYGYNNNIVVPDFSKNWNLLNIGAGMNARINKSSGGYFESRVRQYYDNPGHPADGQPEILDQSEAVEAGQTYTFQNNTLTVNGTLRYLRWKNYLLYSYIQKIYEDFLLMNINVKKVTTNSVSKLSPHLPVGWDGDYYRIEGIDIDFIKNEQKARLVQVA